MLPIGVVLPTKNSAALLPQHLEAMEAWAGQVEQIVVVDSYSTDGTLDLIRARLRHPRLTILDHPPGLYESWNYAISRVTSRFVYIATCGDAITAEGLQLLSEQAEVLDCDVVISKPDFFDATGRRLTDIAWPVDDIISTLKLTKPKRLELQQVMIFAIVHAAKALTGSCASDLFCTEFLRQHPFPTSFGTVGDGAWGILQAATARWGVVPSRFSRFVVHPGSPTSAERKSYAEAAGWDEVVCQMVTSACGAGAVSAEELERLGVNELLKMLSVFLDCKTEFDRRRQARPPWILSPAAWLLRSRRNWAHRRLHELKLTSLQAVKTRIHER